MKRPGRGASLVLAGFAGREYNALAGKSVFSAGPLSRGAPNGALPCKGLRRGAAAGETRPAEQLGGRPCKGRAGGTRNFAKEWK